MVFILALAVLGLMVLCFWTVGLGQRLSLGRAGVFLFFTSLMTALFYGVHRLVDEPLALGALAKMMGVANYAFLILFVRSQRKVMTRTDEIRGMLVVALVSVVHLGLNMTLTGVWQLSVMTAQVLVMIGWLALEAWWWWRVKPDGARFFLLVLVLIHWLLELVGGSFLFSQYATGSANFIDHGWSDLRYEWMWVTLFMGFMTQMAVAGAVAHALREAMASMELLVSQLETRLEEKSSMMVRLVASNAAREAEPQLASLAHELSQPLGAIQLSAEYLAHSGRLSPEEENKILQDILRQNHRAMAIVQGLRNLFVDKSPPQSQLNVNEWLNQWVSHQVPICRAMNVDLQLEVQVDSAVKVLANQVQLEMVLQNLVNNATEELATQVNGLIVVTLTAKDCSVYVDVADNGPGLPLQLHEKVFEMNYSTKSHGMGLGLWLSRRIAQMHGGDLACVSRPEGTCMRLSLPQELV